ncbi:hypothetical protein KC874_04660 [Candidatus Saccharibacteria bacterium]|nr:hypothetical protein [Candidatus Saccharibacteria bacterium]
MEIPDFIVVLASNKLICDRDVNCRRIDISALGSQYNYALTGKNSRGWWKLRWLYYNRIKRDIGVRWMVLDPKLGTMLAVNRGPRRGTDGPEWAATAIDQTAFEIYRTHSVSGGLPSLGKRR